LLAFRSLYFTNFLFRSGSIPLRLLRDEEGGLAEAVRPEEVRLGPGRRGRVRRGSHHRGENKCRLYILLSITEVRMFYLAEMYLVGKFNTFQNLLWLPVVAPFKNGMFKYIGGMEILDQSSLHPLQEYPRQTCPGRGLNLPPICTAGRHSSKELYRQLTLFAM